eukprot:SAG22_NODE_1715_length_3747_cov_2.226700_6_plen_167_part_00
MVMTVSIVRACVRACVTRLHTWFCVLRPQPVQYTLSPQSNEHTQLAPPTPARRGQVLWEDAAGRPSRPPPPTPSRSSLPTWRASRVGRVRARPPGRRDQLGAEVCCPRAVEAQLYMYGGDASSAATCKPRPRASLPRLQLADSWGPKGGRLKLMTCRPSDPPSRPS